MSFHDLELKAWLRQTFFSKIIGGYINADLQFFLIEEEVSCIPTVANLNAQNCQKKEKMTIGIEGDDSSVYGSLS